MSGDSRFVAYLHRNPVLDVVDDEWRSETLSDDDIDLPAEADLPPGEREEPRSIGLPVQKQDDKWAELGLDDLQEA